MNRFFIELRDTTELGLWVYWSELDDGFLISMPMRNWSYHVPTKGESLRDLYELMLLSMDNFWRAEAEIVARYIILWYRGEDQMNSDDFAFAEELLYQEED